MNYTDELRELSKRAWSGDAEAGRKLLVMFAQLAISPDNAHPELVRHVARCIGRIVNCDHEPRESLCIKRPRNRVKDSGKIKERHDAALKEYCSARARGISHDEAILEASKVPGMTESAMKHLYENTKKFDRDFLILLHTPKV